LSWRSGPWIKLSRRLPRRVRDPQSSLEASPWPCWCRHATTSTVGSTWRAKRARRRSWLPKSARGADAQATSSTPQGTRGRWSGAPGRALTHAARYCRWIESTLAWQSSGAEAPGWVAREGVARRGPGRLGHGGASWPTNRLQPTAYSKWAIAYVQVKSVGRAL